MSWELALALDPAADAPVFLQIARAVADDVRRGRLRPGAELPGSRALARSLGVHRNTVLAAYRELAAEGWIEATRRPRHLRLARAAGPRAPPLRRARRRPAPRSRPPRLRPRPGPEPRPRAASAAPVASARPRAHGRRPRRAPGARGAPRPRLPPRRSTADARRAPRLRRPPRARAPARRARRDVSAVRGLAAGPAARAGDARQPDGARPLRARPRAPGDVVAVEALGYRPAWEALRLAGAQPRARSRSTARGSCVDALEELAARERVRAVYVTPHHQYPTTAVLSPGRRLALLDAGRRRSAWPSSRTTTTTSSTTTAAPCSRSPAPTTRAWSSTSARCPRSSPPACASATSSRPRRSSSASPRSRSFVDRQGDHAVERAVAELLEDGEVQRHARRARRVYEARRDALAEALASTLGDALDFDPPAGGMALWARAARRTSTSTPGPRAPSPRGWPSTPGGASRSTAGGGPSCGSGFAALDERELREAVRRMAAALPAAG